MGTIRAFVGGIHPHATQRPVGWARDKETVFLPCTVFTLSDIVNTILKLVFSDETNDKILLWTQNNRKAIYITVTQFVLYILALRMLVDQVVN